MKKESSKAAEISNASVPLPMESARVDKGEDVKILKTAQSPASASACPCQ